MDGGLKHDWTEIGHELRRHGWGVTKVAAHLNVPKSTVRRWFNDNSEPGYHVGRQVIRLHNQVCGFGRSKFLPAWQSVNCL
jgi:hypothetical protein